MVVVWHIRALAKSQGITSAQELTRRTGLNKNTANQLWNEQTQRVDLTTLSALCRVLNCQPGDILSYQPTETKGTEESRGNSVLTPLTA